MNFINTMNGIFAKKKSGQALLFVIIALTIALALGISLAIRSTSSTSRVTRTDTGSRVLASAEGGAERFLALPITDLERAAISGYCPDQTTKVGNTCEVSYQVGGDPVISVAKVSVSLFNTTLTNPDRYEFKVAKGGVKEVVLQGYHPTATGNTPLVICWKPEAGQNAAGDLYLLKYGQYGISVKQGLLSTTRPAGTYTAGPITPSSPGFSLPQASTTCPAGYSYGYTLNITNNDYGLRIKAIYSDSSVTVIPQGGRTLPIQGFHIKSVGELRNQTDITAVKQIKVIDIYKSYPYLPATFDFGLYTESDFN